MSARREKRLRALERRVEALETIAATPVFIHTQGDGKEDYVLEAVWSKETADTYPDKRAGKPSISQEMVDNFILETWTQTAGEKTTIVRAMLRNGFELVEASSCVSPENYDEKLGREICMKKIKDRVWYLLGFLLQTAVNGVK